MDQLAQRLFDGYKTGLKVPTRYRDLDPAIVDPKAWRPTLKSIETLFTDKPRGMFYTGPVGTGKTALLWLIRFEYARRTAVHYATNEQVRIEAHQDLEDIAGADNWDDEVERVLARWFRSHMSRFVLCKHKELINVLRTNVDDRGQLDRSNATIFNEDTILLLDDLGVGYDDKAGWNLSLQEEFFDYRWENNLPTYATTNLTAEELRSWPGWIRIIDRLGDPAWLEACSVSGISKRNAEFQKRGTNVAE